MGGAIGGIGEEPISLPLYHTYEIKPIRISVSLSYIKSSFNFTLLPNLCMPDDFVEHSVSVHQPTPFST